MLRLQERTAKWYLSGEFEDSHLVTDANHNKELGISGIILRKPTTHGSNGRVFSSATIRFTNGMQVFGSLYVDRAGDGLTFGVEQTEPNGNGDRFDINVRVPMSIQAQVIRHALTRAHVVPVQRQAPAQQRQSVPAQRQQAPAQQAQPDYGLMSGGYDIEDIDLS